MSSRRVPGPATDPIETRLRIVAAMLDQAVDELTHVMARLKMDREAAGDQEPDNEETPDA